MTIASNIPNYEDPICFVSEGNETVLVQKMVDYMEKLSDAAYAILQERYKCVFDALANSTNCRSEILFRLPERNLLIGTIRLLIIDNWYVKDKRVQFT